MNVGVVIDAELAAKHPELLFGWPDHRTSRSQMVDHGPNAIGIVVHIYCEDTWQDISGALGSLTVPFDLIVTTVPGREQLIEAIRRDFPDAEIEEMENRGRDIRPFLVLLERGRLDRYRCVCKVHGKKSIARGRKSYMGAIRRRRLLFDLLGAPGLANAIVDMFERDLPSDDRSARLPLPREDYSEELSFSANRPMVLELAERMGVPSARFRLDFFGGTMFWVRPEALKPLGDLRLSSAIPEEKGLLDGTLGHAIERVFSTSVLAAGYKLANSDATGVSDGGKPRPALDEEGWPIAARQSQITTDAAAREDDEFANPALQESAGEALSVDARPRSRRAPST
jgi:lipopolysaccharide biosynthesis protein